MTSESLPIALYKAVQQFGQGILVDNKLTNILLDWGAFVDVPSSKFVLRELISDNCIAKILSFSGNPVKIKSFATILSAQSSFNFQSVEYTCLCIAYSVRQISEAPTFESKAEYPLPSTNLRSEPQKLQGEYTEKLTTGGKLVVSANSWSISYYFPGPDSRYNGTFLSIHSTEIDAYIDAWKENFNKYLQLKQVLPSGGNADYSGKMGMSIRFGWHEGVCIKSHDMPIRTQEELNLVIQDYESAKLKAAQIQKLLNGK